MQTLHAPATPDDDRITFIDDAPVPAPNNVPPWQVLVVDDDASVHAVTRYALEGFLFQGRPVLTVHALSAEQAHAMLAQHERIGLALIDIVMESEQAGLELVRWIREVAGNHLMRIVMRTGQAAQLPEEDVVRDYEIDDFRQKTDLNVVTLRTLVMSRLRAWDSLRAIEAHRRKLSQEVEARTRELDLARMRLVQADRMASIGQLAAGVAHSLNTPLGYLASNLRAVDDAMPTLLKGLDGVATTQLREDLPDLIAESRQGVQSMRRIVQDLTVFARAGSADAQEWVDLNTGIAATVALVLPQWKTPISLDLGPLPNLTCHPAQINLVVLQLLNNAAQAMQGRTGEIVVQSGATAHEVWFAVMDAGCGMSDAVRMRVFEPFFTTRCVGQGYGMGLALVWGIVQAHQGKIDVQSIPDVGTTVTVTLPRQPEDNAP